MGGYLLRVLLLVGVYIAAARLGLTMAFLQANVTAVWPPTGIALAALLLWGHRYWPGVFLGALIVNWLTPAPWPAAVGIATGNTLEALLGAYVVGRFIGPRPFDRPADVVRFVLLAGVLCTLVSATFGLTSLHLAGLVPRHLVDSLFVTWWVGDAAGAIIYTPLILALYEASRERWGARRVAEAFVLVTTVVASTLAAFGPWPFSHLPIAYLPIPLLVWASFRFERLGTTTAVFLVTAIANWGTVNGHGSFASASPNQSLVLLQSYIAVVAVSMVILGAVTSQRSQAWKELERSYSVLKAQQEGSLDGIMVVDEHQHVEDYNRHFQEIWDIPPELMNGGDDQRLLRFVSEKVADWPAFMDKVQSLYAHPGVSSQDELSLVDGRVLERYTTSAVSPEGTYYGRVWYFRDVTERKRMERTMREQFEDLKKLDALKNDFVSTVSHELRTPLTSLVGFAEFLEDRIAGPLTEEQAAFVQHIQDNARRLRVLVDDLLDFARLQSGDLPLVPQPTGLATLAAETVASLEPQARTAGISLETVLPSDPMSLSLDPTRISQVLANLVGNAIKFTPRGGRITVRVAPDHGGARVTVTDTGEGIDREHLPHLFERFYQADRGNTRQKGGAGLGLAICKAIVEAHGGAIGVESEPKRGSTFWFTLPADGPTGES